MRASPSKSRIYSSCTLSGADIIPLKTAPDFPRTHSKSLNLANNSGMVLFLLAICAAVLCLKPQAFCVNADQGSNLLYPQFGGPLWSWPMPAASLLRAVMRNVHFFLPLEYPLRLLCLCVCVGLEFSLASFLFSPLHGFAAGIVALALYTGPYCDFEQLVYSSSVLLLANVLVLDFRSEPAKDRAVGAATAFSLLIRTPLLLFPFLYLLCGSKTTLRRLPGRLLRLFCCALAVALIWGLVIYAERGSITFLDQSRATANVLTGAMGLKGTVEGDSHALAGLPAGGSAMLWAVRMVCAHPLRFIGAVVSRAATAAGSNVPLLAVALAGIWFSRRRSGVLSVALLAGYLFAVHCMMSIEYRYFIPFWFLCAPLACGAINILPGLAGLPGCAAARTVLRACSAAAVVLAAFSLALVLRHPFLYQKPVDYLRVLAQSPDNSWLWESYGEHLLEAGDFNGAKKAFFNAYVIDPYKVRGYAVALLLSGNYDDMKIASLLRTLRSRHINNGDTLLVVMLMRLEQGRCDEAQALFAEQESLVNFLRFASGPYELKMQSLLRERSLASEMRNTGGLLRSLSVARQRVIVPRLALIGLDPRQIAGEEFFRDPPRTVQLAQAGVADAQRGDYARAEKELEQSIELNPYYIPAYSTLGAVYMHNRRMDKLIRLYRKAIDTNKDVQKSPLLDLIEADYKIAVSRRGGIAGGRDGV